MQLNKFTDYGLRLLMQVMVSAPERVSVHTVAETYGISEHHVAKVASHLARAGFILSGRGRAGGLTLAKNPRDISIGDVVRSLSGDMPVVECFKTGNCDCRALAQCGLRGPLYEAQQAFYAVLDRYTLDDVVARRDLMKQLLDVG
jgi:Rrf2 family transcriptional regulator, nitric oxide-sensitive transcriptional repressor